MFVTKVEQLQYLKAFTILYCPSSFSGRFNSLLFVKRSFGRFRSILQRNFINILAKEAVVWFGKGPTRICCAAL
jgi:hypothetical protein